MTQAKLHAGGCHCGKIRYEVKAAVDTVIRLQLLDVLEEGLAAHVRR